MSKTRTDPKKAASNNKPQPKGASEAEKYFNNIKNRPQTTPLLQEIQTYVMKNVLKGIRKGQVMFSQEPFNVNLLLVKEKEKQVKQEEEERIQKEKRNKLLKEVERLDMRKHKRAESESRVVNKQFLNPDLLHYKPNSILTKEEHETLITKITNAHNSQSKKRKQRIQKLEEGWKEDEEREKRMKEQKIQMQKQKRRMDIERKLEMRKEINEKISVLESKNNRELDQIKKKKPLYEKLESQYQSQVVLPSLEEKKKRLREIRQLSRGFSVKDINQHEKRYIHHRSNSGYFNHSKISQQWTYKAPQKTERLNKILIQQLSEKKKYVEKEKRENEERKNRRQNYNDYIQKNFAPKPDPQKQKEIDTRVANCHTKKLETTKDARQVGIGYLKQVKNMKKKREDSKDLEIPHQQGQKNEGYQNYLKLHETDYYEKKKKEKLQNLLNSNSDNLQKARILELQSRKMSEALHQKEELLKVSKDPGLVQDTNDLLMLNIQAKMGLINIYNEQK